MCRDTPIGSGSAGHGEDVFRAVYGTLRTIAANRLRSERADFTLSATDLVHEAYLRLRRSELPIPEDRAGFLGLASRVMQWAVVDHARRRRSKAAQGRSLDFDVVLDTLVERCASAPGRLAEALDEIERLQPIPATVTRLRFFVGLTLEEIAQELDLSLSTVESEWRFARAYLRRRLEELGGD